MLSFQKVGKTNINFLFDLAVRSSFLWSIVDQGPTYLFTIIFGDNEGVLCDIFSLLSPVMII